MTAPLQGQWQIALLQHIAERFASHEQLGTIQKSVTAQQGALDTQTTELRSVSSQVAATSATSQAHMAVFSQKLTAVVTNLEQLSRLVANLPTSTSGPSSSVDHHPPSFCRSMQCRHWRHSSRGSPEPRRTRAPLGALHTDPQLHTYKCNDDYAEWFGQCRKF